MRSVGACSALFRGPHEAAASALAAAGLNCVALAVNGPGLVFESPAQFTEDRCRQASEPYLKAGLQISCLTFFANLLDADLRRRHRAIVLCRALVRSCRAFGTTVLVLRSGKSEEPQAPVGDRSTSAQQWRELQAILRSFLHLAADMGFRILIEPDPTDLIASAADIERLWQEMDCHPALAFVMDPASLLQAKAPAKVPSPTAELCDRLGPLTPLLYAKGPCQGLDYAPLLRRHMIYHPAAPIIFRNVRAEELGAARTYVENCLST